MNPLLLFHISFICFGFEVLPSIFLILADALHMALIVFSPTDRTLLRNSLSNYGVSSELGVLWGHNHNRLMMVCMWYRQRIRYIMSDSYQKSFPQSMQDKTWHPRHIEVCFWIWAFFNDSPHALQVKNTIAGQQHSHTHTNSPHHYYLIDYCKRVRL